MSLWMTFLDFNHESITVNMDNIHRIQPHTLWDGSLGLMLDGYAVRYSYQELCLQLNAFAMMHPYEPIPEDTN